MLRRFKYFFLLILPIILFLSIYTWNWHTKSLDSVATKVGLETAGLALETKTISGETISGFWHKYIDLRGVYDKNKQLVAENNRLRMLVQEQQESVSEAARLKLLLAFSPPSKWNKRGVRIVGKRVGSSAIHKTIIIDTGYVSGAHEELPLVSANGLVGQIIKTAAHFSQVLLVTDTDSRIPVISMKNRVVGIVVGTGDDNHLVVEFVGQDQKLDNNEMLLTSGIAGIFPKGIPVAKVLSVKRSETQLFLDVSAKSLDTFENLEELLLLYPEAGQVIPPKLLEKEEPNAKRGQ